MGVLNQFYEKDLEAMIISNVSSMASRGLPIFYKNTKTQIPMFFGGVCDILTWEIIGDELFIRVIELKRDAVDIKAILQAVNYHSSNLVFQKGISPFKRVTSDVVLIGRYIDNDAAELTYLDIRNLSIYLYDFDFSGLFFTKTENAYNECVSSSGVNIKEGSNSYVKAKKILDFLINGSPIETLTN